jgi:D-alanyl-D-alanine carboxypeptidase
MNSKKLTIILLLSTLIFTQARAEEEGCSDVYSYLVFEANTGNILSETRSEKITYPASLVKLMTLYLTFEAIEAKKISPTDIITISGRGEEISNVNEITTLHLKEGDEITVKQAIQGTIVKSFNEAAVSLGEIIAGSEWKFARLMNKKAAELGMFDTSFRNASGLHEEGQYTTSYDLARLVLALRKDFPGYYPLFKLKEFEFAGQKYETHNHVLLEYDGAEGMKTGFTSAAGFNLISSAKKSQDRVISVLLSCATSDKRDIFTKELLDKSFSTLKEDSLTGSSNKVLRKFNYGKKKKYYEGAMHFGMVAE